MNDAHYKQRAAIAFLLLRNNQWKTSTNTFAMFMEVLRSTEVPLVAGRKVWNVHNLGINIY
jgi:hypothetical protein